MDDEEPVSDVTEYRREPESVAKPGGQSGMVATGLSTYGKPMAVIAGVGIAGYMAVGIVETAARVIGFVVGTTIVYYGIRAYRRYKNHDDPT